MRDKILHVPLLGALRKQVKRHIGASFLSLCPPGVPLSPEEAHHRSSECNFGGNRFAVIAEDPLQLLRHTFGVHHVVRPDSRLIFLMSVFIKITFISSTTSGHDGVGLPEAGLALRREAP